MDIRDRILYEDDQILVLDKPAGIAVESARVTEPDLISMLQNAAAGTGESFFIVHRLDQVVSGVMVFAKTKKAAAELSKQLTDGVMKKIYRAKVCGPIPSLSGELRDYLWKDSKNNLSKVVSPADRAADAAEKRQGCPTGGKKQSSLPRGAKEAVLRYKKISEDTLEIELLTGRHHQIRAQLAHAGMPIAGDRKYGAPSASAEDLPRGSIALQAFRLTFLHPRTGKTMTFTQQL